VNFTDVIAEALGRGGHPDYYRLYKQGGAMDEAVAAARKFLQSNGVQVDETSVQSLTADIFNETGLAGPRDAFRDAFTTLAREG
jgi:heterodisulfide reductase subunit D